MHGLQYHAARGARQLKHASAASAPRKAPADARENADAHADAPQHELPLRERERGHVPTNMQFRGKRERRPSLTSAAWGPPLMRSPV